MYSIYTHTTNITTDFAPDFPREAIPDFQKELQHFRIMPNGKELVLETLLKFCHFESAPDSSFRDNLGAPPPLPTAEEEEEEQKKKKKNGGSSRESDGDAAQDMMMNDSFSSGGGESSNNGKQQQSSSGASTPTNGPSENGMKKKSPKSLTYSQIRWIGKFI